MFFSLASATEEEETVATSPEGEQDVDNEETTQGSRLILVDASLCLMCRACVCMYVYMCVCECV